MMALVHSKDYEKHETGNHPESNQRIRVIMDALEKEGILNQINSESIENGSDLVNGKIDFSARKWLHMKIF